MGQISVHPIEGIGEVDAGTDIAALVVGAADRSGGLVDGDCLVVTQKIVSKAEGRIVTLADRPDAKQALVAQESERILRRRGDLVISQTRHGFVCANAGVDLSNVPPGTAALLPIDPDRSARRLRDSIRGLHHLDVAVIISDTFGRPWRRVLTDVAIGVAGIAAVLDLRDSTDASGRALEVTEIAIADEIASAAELAMGKASGIPAVIVRGLDSDWFGEGSARDLVRPPSEDLFR